jgi:hypothetical protein
MAVQRINAIVPASAVRATGPALPGLPAPGGTLHIALDKVLGKDLLGTTSEGLALRLQGLGQLAETLEAGDVLLLRVVSSTPRLELALVETRSPMRGSPDGPVTEHMPPAMRADQLALRQLVRPLPDPEQLAHSWQSHMRDSLLGRRGPQEAGSGTVVVQMPDRWVLPVASAGAWVHMRMLHGEPRSRGQGRGVPPTPAGLRIEFALKALGPTVLQLQMSAGALLVALAVHGDPMAQVARLAMPEVVMTLSRVGWRVLRWRVEADARSLRLESTVASPAALAVGSQLLRAAAHAVLALAQALDPPGLAILPAES